MDKPQINLAQSQDTGFGTFLVIENDLIGNQSDLTIKYFDSNGILGSE